MGGGPDLADHWVEGGKEPLSEMSLGAGGSAEGRVQLCSPFLLLMQTCSKWKAPRAEQKELFLHCTWGKNSPGLCLLLGDVLVSLNWGVGRGKSVRVRLQFGNKQANKNEQS